MRSLIADKDQTLAIFLPDRPIRFVANPTRAEQILGNLLTNAGKHSEPGRSIALVAFAEGYEVVFQVRDDGVGIPAEMLSRIFGLFTQIDSAIDRTEGGLGIGLTLVQSLVEMHGGTVRATSEGLGHGSEFVARLPIGQPPAVPENGDVARPGVRSRTGRVLVVDDNAETARLTARMLRHHGYQVELAYDGHAAVDLARSFRPAIILLDIGLPGMNGYEVASLLRGDACCQQALMIAISGYGEELSRRRSREAGFTHHLTRPLDFEHLLGLLVD